MNCVKKSRKTKRTSSGSISARADQRVPNHAGRSLRVARPYAQPVTQAGRINADDKHQRHEPHRVLRQQKNLEQIQRKCQHVHANNRQEPRQRGPAKQAANGAQFEHRPEPILRGEPRLQKGEPCQDGDEQHAAQDRDENRQPFRLYWRRQTGASERRSRGRPPRNLALRAKNGAATADPETKAAISLAARSK